MIVMPEKGIALTQQSLVSFPPFLRTCLKDELRNSKAESGPSGPDCCHTTADCVS